MCTVAILFGCVLHGGLHGAARAIVPFPSSAKVCAITMGPGTCRRVPTSPHVLHMCMHRDFILWL